MPSPASALVNRAQTLRIAGRLIEAVRSCRIAIREAAARPVLLGRAWQVFGIALYDLGRPARAARAWAAAARIFERAARMHDVCDRLRDEAAALVLAGRPGEAEGRLARIAALGTANVDLDVPPPAVTARRPESIEAAITALPTMVTRSSTLLVSFWISIRLGTPRR